MSSLSLLNSSGSIPFLSSDIRRDRHHLKQKISNELSARVIKIVNDLGILNNIPEIGKRPLHDQIFTELNDKFVTCISDINPTFTAKLGRINNDLNNKFNEEVNAGFGKINTELNSKLTMEAEKKNKARDDDFTRKAQKILNNITTKVKKPAVMNLAELMLLSKISKTK
ncbi:hypothetical protein RirG_041950 [Rhizophagus irregularis DAOM 197198w]|uniref:Uncharacterized protein n=1 Tax=Rhizophagus irregularis (strain DAOM 197198w) TaxID=1432141 RepID=A0A015N8C3_RHIIW|nr:hypothetical protein RirG_041950 [Rhizophagus irregularis DAOM 197198w]